MDIEKLDKLIDVSTSRAINVVNGYGLTEERNNFLLAIAELIKARTMVCTGAVNVDDFAETMSKKLLK